MTLRLAKFTDALDIYEAQGTKVCRYNWHSAGFLGWPFQMLKYKIYFFNKINGSTFYQTALENCYGLKIAKC